MKIFKYFNSVFNVLLFALLSVTLFSQGQTDIYNMRLDKASWNSEDGSVGITGTFFVRNPSVVDDGFFTVGYKIAGDNSWQGGGNMVKYSPQEGQYLFIKVKKDFTTINSTQQIVIRTKIKDKTEYVERTVSFKVIAENGFKKIAGIPNSNAPALEAGKNVTPSVVPFSPSIPGAKTSIEIEGNKTTGIPYVGVTADGVSSIRISLSGVSGDRVKFEIPYEMGALKYKGGLQAVNEPKIDQYISLANGSATVFFHPPKYIAAHLLTNTTTINGRQISCVNVPIKFTFKDAQGHIQTQTQSIKILRPMVFLVHGFTGDASTWNGLAARLKSKKFDCNAENYYALNDDWGILKRQDVFAQSRKLSETIDLAKSEYAASGVKMLKVDVVSHSMGGLIARYYVHGYNNYRNDVRKLFMVGTPNHGVGYTKQLLGSAGAMSSMGHFGMLADVHERSAFMKGLNKNEAQGGHLNPHVEYYNLYGTVDDGVTSESSAYMPGVLYKRIKKCCHSPSPSFLSTLGTPLTVHPEVYAEVAEYLQKEIIRLPLKNVKAEIVSQKGEVYVENYAGRKMVLVTPSEISTFTKVDSRENSATTISFTINGTEWGRLITGQNTSLELKNYSPQTFTVRVIKGKARFRSGIASQDGSHFQVEILPDHYNPQEWYTFNPKIDINSIGTTFDVIYENGIARINLIEGKLRLDDNEANKFTGISTPQTIVVSENGQMNTQSLQPDNELTQLDTGGPVKGGAETKPGNPLFAHVTTGGTLVNPRQKAATPGHSGSCLGQLKVQFIVPVGAPSSPQQQAQMKMLDDHNKWELRWFQQAEAAFKNGASPKPLSGTFRPDHTGNPGSGKYYSETVTLFKPMQVATVEGNARGFRLARGESQSDQHFTPIAMAKGKILPCGSYKIYVDPIENIEKTWATITFSEAGAVP